MMESEFSAYAVETNAEVADGSSSPETSLDLATMREQIRTRVGEKGMCLLADVLNGVVFDGLPKHQMPDALAVEVEDANSLTSVGKKWDVDAVRLADAIRRMHVDSVVHVIQAIDRFYQPGEGNGSPIDYI